eukprot:Pgem_evm1s2956
MAGSTPGINDSEVFFRKENGGDRRLAWEQSRSTGQILYESSSTNECLEAPQQLGQIATKVTCNSSNPRQKFELIPSMACTALGTCTSTSCDQGFYVLHGGCTTCPEGNYCRSGVSSYTSCPEGNYCPSGSAAPNPCSPGDYCPSSSAVPEDCPVNHYCDNLAKTKTKCTDGKFCPVIRSTVEQDCPDYSICSGGIIAACSPGYYMKASTCTICEAGKNCTSGTLQACQAGFFCEVGTGSSSKRPEPCPAEHYCPLNSKLGITCPAGNYCPPGAKTYIPCSKSYYCPSSSAVQEDCPVNHYCDNLAKTKTKCADGKFCPVRSTVEKDCPDYSICSGGIITACSPGYYMKASTCTICEA